MNPSNFSVANNPLGRALARFGRILWWRRYLRALCAGSGFGSLLLAIALIIQKIWWPEAGEILAASAGGLLALNLLGAAAWARRGAPSAAALAAHLDRAVGAEGTIMALSARPHDDPAWPGWWSGWSDPVAHARPAQDGAWRDALRPLIVGAVALFIATLIPARVIPSPTGPTPWRAHFAATETQLHALEDHGLITPERAEKLEAQLKRLRAQAQKQGMSAAVWEGLDGTNDRLRRHRGEARKRWAEAVAAAKNADQPREGDPQRRRRHRNRLKDRDAPDGPLGANGLQPDQRDKQRRILQQLSEARQGERLDQLARSLKALAQTAPGLMPRGSAIQEWMAGLSPKAREAMDKALEQLAQSAARDAAHNDAHNDARDAAQGQGQDVSALAEALHRALEAAGESGQGLDPEQIARALDALARAIQGGVGEGERAAALWGMGPPGTRGGETAAQMVARLVRLGRARLGAGAGAGARGGSASPLSRRPEGGDSPTPGRVSSLPKLPKGARRNPDGSITIAETLRDAEDDPASHEALVRAATRAMAPAHADALRARISPRHRGVVSRYFDTPPSPRESP